MDVLVPLSFRLLHIIITFIPAPVSFNKANGKHPHNHDEKDADDNLNGYIQKTHQSIVFCQCHKNIIHEIREI